MNELRLKDTHIQYAYIRQSSGRLDVEAADGSRIGRMEVSGKRDGSACTLNIEQANVGTVLWTPQDSTARLNVRLSKPMELTQVGDK